MMLSQGDRFDLIAREPRQMRGRAAERLPEKEEEDKEKPPRNQAVGWFVDTPKASVDF